MKVRFSYGVTGRSGFDKYISLAKYTGYGDYYSDRFGWIKGYGPGNNPNYDLGWEKQVSYNLGIDYIVALDGCRLAIVERPVTAVKDIRIIVPSKTMTEVAHLLPNDDEEPVHISANRRYVVFMAGGYTIMSRLIEGEFLNYRNVIPADSRTRVTIDTKEFIETIERASLIITERLKNPLRISFTEGRVVVRCQTNLGRVVDEFNADCEGDEVEIGFNNRYLLDALRNARTEKVRMEISGPLSPVKVLPAEGNDFLYLVLPVRFKND